MASRPIYLTDQSGVRIADRDVMPVGDHFEGAISLDLTPPHLRQLFKQFEEIVDGQVFSLLDDIEEKIRSIPIQAVFGNGSAALVWDLQVFPNANCISFKIRQARTV